MFLEKILDTIYNWQTLVGAFIPIAFTVAMFWYQNKKSFKQDLGLLEKIIVQSINDLDVLRDELELFVSRVSDLINNVNSVAENQYYVGLTNFPVHQVQFDNRISNTRTRSLYLANKLMMSYVILKSINSQISGFREDFNNLMMRNHDIVVAYKNPKEGIGISPKDQKDLLLSGLISMRDTMRDDVVGKNIPTAINVLLRARTYLLKYIKHPHITKFTHEGIWNRTIKKEDGIELVEKKFEKDLQKEMEKIQKRKAKNSD